jgi:hypothetical protein
MPFDIYDANKHLERLEYLPSQFESVFADLRGQTEHMLLLGETIGDAAASFGLEPPPPSYAAGAWNSWYRLFQEMSVRASKNAAAEAQRKAAEPKYTGPDQQVYIQNRVNVLESMRQGLLTWDELEWAGLQRHDLDELKTTNQDDIAKYGHFCPRRDWPESAVRPANAIATLRELSAHQRAILPFLIEYKKQISQDVAQQVAELKQQMGEIQDVLNLRLKHPRKKFLVPPTLRKVHSS